MFLKSPGINNILDYCASKNEYNPEDPYETRESNDYTEGYIARIEVLNEIVHDLKDENYRLRRNNDNLRTENKRLRNSLNMEKKKVRAMSKRIEAMKLIV